MKKCDLPQCGKPLPEKKNEVWHDGFGFDYCSQRCAKTKWKKKMLWTRAERLGK